MYCISKVGLPAIEVEKEYNPYTYVNQRKIKILVADDNGFEISLIKQMLQTYSFL
jgi:PleD family two-component response regulator